MGIEVKWGFENLGGWGRVGPPTSFTLTGGGGISPATAPSGWTASSPSPPLTPLSPSGSSPRRRRRRLPCRLAAPSVPSPWGFYIFTIITDGTHPFSTLKMTPIYLDIYLTLLFRASYFTIFALRDRPRSVTRWRTVSKSM